MPDWPHSPLHRLSEGGTYIVTAATYEKAPVFRSGPRLALLCNTLLKLSAEYAWSLQAWAVFPNHYHFVASCASGDSLRTLIRHIHSATAREINQIDERSARKVWFQYWETQITNQRSYFARLHYVHENAVRHKLVARAANYPWCSAGWFERKAVASFRKTVLAFPCDRVSLPDSFEVVPADVTDG